MQIDIPGDGSMGETLEEGRAGHVGEVCADTGIILDHKVLRV